MSAVGPILTFATNHPDYWKLLVPGEEPAQLEELEPRRRAAFEAARAEVKQKVAELIRAGHSALEQRAEETANAGSIDLRKVFSRTPNATSHSKGRAYWKLRGGRGKQSWLNFYLSPAGEVVRLYVDVQTSKGRASVLERAFAEAVGEGEFDANEGYAWVGASLPEDGELSQIADGAVRKIWPGVVRFIELIDGGAEDDNDD